MIAHHLNAFSSADQILLMNDGAILARGGHAELIGASSIYAALCGLSGDLSQS